MRQADSTGRGEIVIGPWHSSGVGGDVRIWRSPPVYRSDRTPFPDLLAFSPPNGTSIQLVRIRGNSWAIPRAWESGGRNWRRISESDEATLRNGTSPGASG